MLSKKYSSLPDNMINKLNIVHTVINYSLSIAVWKSTKTESLLLALWYYLNAEFLNNKFFYPFIIVWIIYLLILYLGFYLICEGRELKLKSILQIRCRILLLTEDWFRFVVLKFLVLAVFCMTIRCRIFMASWSGINFLYQRNVYVSIFS